MHISHILLLIVAINAVKFLEEPAILLQDEEKPYMLHTIFAQQSSLYTDEELSKNIEMSKTSTKEFNYEDENLSTLGAADPSQVLLATQYEKDLPAQGDCVILYQSCDFKGTSGKVCKTEEALNFQLPVYSIYVPLGQQFTTLDSNKNEQIAFLASEKCLKEPLIMADSQKDVFIAKASVSLTGEEELKAEEAIAPQPQLLIDTQETFDAPEVQDAPEQQATANVEAQPVENMEAQPVENMEAQPVEQQAQPVEQQAQPAEATEAQPTEATEAQSTEATEAQSTETTEAQPSETTEAQPVETTEAQPVETTEAQPTETTEAQPTETTEVQPQTAETAQAGTQAVETSEAQPIVDAQPVAEPLVGQSQ